MNVAALRQPIGALGSNAEMRMSLTRWKLTPDLGMPTPNQAETVKSRACVEVIDDTPQVGDDMTRTSTKVEQDIKYRHHDRYRGWGKPYQPREQRGSDGHYSDLRQLRSLADWCTPDYLRNGDNPGSDSVEFPSAPSKSNLGRIRTQILGKLNQIFWQANQELSRSLVLRKCVETRGVPSYCNEEDGMARHSSKEEKAYSRMRVGWDLETKPRTGVLRGGVQSLSPYLLV